MVEFYWKGLKMMKRRTGDGIGEIQTLIGPTLTMYGRLVGHENMVVLGTVEGDCDLAATLVLAEHARWKGTIRAQNLVVAGEVEGDLLIAGKLELEPTARITGSLSAPEIAIAEGAIIEGQIQTPEKSRVISFTQKRTNGITALVRQFFESRTRES